MTLDVFRFHFRFFDQLERHFGQDERRSEDVRHRSDHEMHPLSQRILCQAQQVITDDASSVSNNTLSGPRSYIFS